MALRSRRHGLFSFVPERPCIGWQGVLGRSMGFSGQLVHDLGNLILFLTAACCASGFVHLVRDQKINGDLLISQL